MDASCLNNACNEHEDEATEDNSSPNVADADPAIEPNLTIETERLHRGPDTMGEVEPEGAEPNDVDDVEDTKEWCKEHGIDYEDELFKAFSRDKIMERNAKKCRT